MSVGNYTVLTWANQYIEPSKTLAYNAMQPMSSALLCGAMIAGGWNARHPTQLLDVPGSSLCGAALIVAGLGFLLRDTAAISISSSGSNSADGVVSDPPGHRNRI